MYVTLTVAVRFPAFYTNTGIIGGTVETGEVNEVSSDGAS